MKEDLIKKAYEDHNGVWPYDENAMVISMCNNPIIGEGKYRSFDGVELDFDYNSFVKRNWQWVGTKADFDACGEGLEIPECATHRRGGGFYKVDSDVSYWDKDNEFWMGVTRPYTVEDWLKELTPIESPIDFSLEVGIEYELRNDQCYDVDYGKDVIGKEVTVESLFTCKHGSIPMATVSHYGNCYCFRQSMLHPIKTDREKHKEAVLNMVDKDKGFLPDYIAENIADYIIEIINAPSS